ncbi:DNA ligase-like domain-containing protein [Streptomyces olivochromogenes]|uniref:hypothetical protein n=1 Tax=Streptomyces olivochromogenes TaxID=1963 RepID=UPI0036CAED2F
MTLQLTPTAWTTTGVTSLWEITTDQVGSAVDDLMGYARRGLATPLRAGQSYPERRKALEWLFTDQQLEPPWTLCPATADPQQAAEWQWSSVGVEGLVFKRLDQTY